MARWKGARREGLSSTALRTKVWIYWFCDLAIGPYQRADAEG